MAFSEQQEEGAGWLTGRKAIVTGADRPHRPGRRDRLGAAAGEGADVVLSSKPEEEPDAQEVVQLAKDAHGRRVARRPLTERSTAGGWSPPRWSSSAASTSWCAQRRPGQPAEPAPAYVVLASQESSYVSAAALAVTGVMPTP